jgi:hypothetical protein
MSSTARGGKRSPADFYSTPAWPVHRFLERCPLPGGVWYEFMAGEGHIIRAVNEKRSDVQWIATELREECRPKLEPLARVQIRSFFDVKPPTLAKPAVAISNVAFSIAMEAILYSLKFSPNVVHLLRLNFFGSEKRNDFFQSNMPDVYVIPDRVSFAISVSCKGTRGEDGYTAPCGWAEVYPRGVDYPRRCPQCGLEVSVSTTDSIEYAWFHWGPERGRKRGMIEVLEHTPEEQRK